VRDLELRQAVVFRDLAPINELWLNLRSARISDRIGGAVVQAYATPEVYVSLPHDTQAWVQWHGLSKLRASSGGRLLSEHYWKGEYTSTLAGWIPLFDATVTLGKLSSGPPG
jgi:hypothetical protein